MADGAAGGEPDGNHPKGGNDGSGGLGPIGPVLDWVKEHADRRVLSILAGAVASACALALMALLGVNPESQWRPLLIIIGIGALLTVLVSIIHKNRYLFVAWQIFLSVLLMVWLVVFLTRGLLAQQLPPQYLVSLDCFLAPWETCRQVADEVADADTAAVSSMQEAGPRVPAATGREQFSPANYRVYVQFAGDIRRDDVRALMAQLQDARWRVEGFEGGGQRVAGAAGYLEVRYPATEDRPAAEALADALFASGRVTARPDVVLVGSLDSGTLEIWIGRNFGISVSAAKRAMAALEGYDGPIDESVDPALTLAIQSYQTRKGLYPDGLIGPRTLASLVEDLPTIFNAP